MDDVEYAKQIFERHLQATTAGWEGKTLLEIGPGDSVITSLLAKSSGFGSSYLIDVDSYATKSIEIYNQAVCEINATNPDRLLEKFHSFEQLLADTNTNYFTGGLSSLKEIPDNSVDFLFSNSVLQFVKQVEVPLYLGEFRRILKPGGYASHTVDLKDMICGSIYHLSLSNKIWEHRYSPFKLLPCYTNRINMYRWIDIFSDAGFTEIKIADTSTWEYLPISEKMVHADYFSKISELLIHSFEIKMRVKL
tara:strand:- start:1398 stop:2147 length:750 start_codon:yes stop_codon:yes gene_type:complete